MDELKRAFKAGYRAACEMFAPFGFDGDSEVEMEEAWESYNQGVANQPDAKKLATEIQEACQYGASVSDIMHMLTRTA